MLLGLKLGSTSLALFNLSATATKNDLSLIAVIMKAPSTKVRFAEAQKLLDYGFNTYKINVILNKEKELGKVRIEKGKKDYATLVLLKDATKLQKVTEEEKEYTFNIKLNKIIKAPIKKGDIIGKVQIIDSESNIILESDITIKENIKKANLWDMFKRNLNELTSGKRLISN